MSLYYVILLNVAKSMLVAVQIYDAWHHRVWLIVVPFLLTWVAGWPGGPFDRAARELEGLCNDKKQGYVYESESSGRELRPAGLWLLIWL